MAHIDIDRDSFPTFHQKELNDYMKGWNACLKSVLQQESTADVVEVVRCKDCVYRRESGKTNRIFCTYHGDGYEFETYSNDYCCNGKPQKEV